MINLFKKIIRKTIFYKPLLYIKHKFFSNSKPKISLKSQIASLRDYRNGNIKFSIVVSVYNVKKKYLKQMIKSVLAQTYSNWELILVNASDNKAKYSWIKKMITNNKIIYKEKENKGISDNTNFACKLATGDYLVFLDHDDLLSPIALAENYKIIARNKAKALYSDETVYRNGAYYPFFKPDFSPDLLYAQNYICHLLVVEKKTFISIGMLNSKFDGAQDYDLVLRLYEKKIHFYHISKVLYKWRAHKESTSRNPNSKPHANDNGLLSLNEHLNRLKLNAYATQDKNTFTYDVRFNIFGNPKASLIILMKDNLKLTSNFISSITAKTNYKNYEIILINNQSKEPQTNNWLNMIHRKTKIKVINANCPFNWSKLNNIGIDNSSGDVLVFLNNDMEIISGDWLTRLVENALRPNIGIVGALLTYDDKKIQHAGVVLGLGGFADHIYKNEMLSHFVYPYVSPVVNRNVLANTGACIAIERAKIQKIGRFDENFIICGSDVEFCLRAYENGYLNMYNSHVRLTHYESKSRDSYIPEIDFVCSKDKYGKYLQNGDPYFNINLSLNSLKPRGVYYEY